MAHTSGSRCWARWLGFLLAAAMGVTAAWLWAAPRRLDAATPTPPGVVPQPVRPPAGVTVTLELSSTTPQRGTPVTMGLRVRNDGREPVTYWTGGQQYELWVEDASGEVAWRWGEGKAFLMYLVEERLLPGEERTVQESWDVTAGTAGPAAGAPLPPGHYVARGAWIATGDGGGHQGWWSNPVPLEVR